MYKIDLMEKEERKDVEYYELKKVEYKDKKEEIEEEVKKAIGSVTFLKIKNREHLSNYWYYPYFRIILREASWEVAKIFIHAHWLEPLLRKKAFKDDPKLIYRNYALYVLED